MTPASDSARRARPLLGTFVEIAASGAPRADLDAAIERAFRAVADVHGLMSFQEPQSDVSRVNRDASTRAVPVHPWTYDVLRLACELREVSAGAFDIAVADVAKHLGPVDLRPRRHVRLAPGVRIDLSGIAKGFAVDRALEILRAHGVPRAVVNAGGDLAAFGRDAVAVHVRDPRHPFQILCRVDVRNEALASSGGVFDPFESALASGVTVIDPRTQKPARAARGVTVRAPSCVVADALTKLVMVAGESAAGLLVRYQARAMLVPREGDPLVTREWSAGAHIAS